MITASPGMKAGVSSPVPAVPSWVKFMDIPEGTPVNEWGPQPEMFPAAKTKSPDVLPFRSWQLQNDFDEEITKIISKAKDYGVNNLQFSHDMVMFGHELLKDAERIERFNGYIDQAQKEGLTVHVWTKEFAELPESITSQEKWFDQDEVWEFLDDRYSRLFEAMPNLDGLVLTFHETPIKVFYVESELSMAERIAKMINFLQAICDRYDATLVARTFAHLPKEVEAVAESFTMISPKVVLMSKCVPHDWQVFYPHNKAIGRFADRRHIIEFDPGAEYYGKGHVPYLYPEYIHFRLNYARDRNTAGYVIRIEREQGSRPRRNPSAIPGISPKSGYNEINLYAFQRFSEDPSVTPDQVWEEYMVARTGEGPHIKPLIEAMKLTDDALNRCYFMLGTWYNDHSRLPSFGYGYSRSRRIAKWHKVYKPIVEMIQNGTETAVEEVFRESDEAVALARLALYRLSEAKLKGLKDEHYKEFEEQLNALLEETQTWAAHRKNFILEVVAKNKAEQGS